jgi:long-chain fatty acid transport protein
MRDLKAGVGISAPFGLKTEYASDWMGRFQAIKSDVSTFNVNPSLSYKISDTISVGGGLDYQQLNAELTKAVNYVAVAFAAGGGAAAAAVPAANAEGTVAVKGKDTAWGYNFGAMFQLAPETRLGVSYRSSIKYKVTGTVAFTNVPTAVLGNLDGNVNLDLEVPDSESVALQHKLNQQWTLLADVTRTGWSKIKQLQIVRDTGQTLDNTPENFKNTWRVGVGAVHRYNDAWTIKMGFAYDQTPVNDNDRTARLPDNNRLWLSVGGQYKLSKDGTLDFGLAHLFIKDAPINQNAGNATAFGQLVGTYKGSVDILGAQFAYRF